MNNSTISAAINEAEIIARGELFLYTLKKPVTEVHIVIKHIIRYKYLPVIAKEKTMNNINIRFKAYTIKHWVS